MMSDRVVIAGIFLFGFATELRANGFRIECRQERGSHGGRIWLYRMTASAAEESAA